MSFASAFFFVEIGAAMRVKICHISQKENARFPLDIFPSICYYKLV